MISRASHPRRFRLPALAIAALGVVPCVLQAQSPAGAPPQFEVASIKPSRPGVDERDMRIDFPRGRFEAHNVTLKDLLSAMSAFHGRVQGGPRWVESDRYDIIAKAAGDIQPSERAAMIMALLAERFKLAVHHEDKEEPGLTLTTGKQPPNLSPAKEGEPGAIQLTGQRLTFQAESMAEFVLYLRQILHTTVANRTGIPGKFDFALDLAPSTVALPSAGAPQPDSFADRLRDAAEQFGFRLETAKVAVGITVIDRVERPTEN